jgi:hypothetical protein
MALRKSLCVYVPWPELAAVLDIPLSDSALPARADCPLCGGRLHVYEDTTKGGAWHHCFDCGSRGDLIELAAACWDVTIEAAVERLYAEGMPLPEESLSEERVARYKKEHALRVREINSFWKASSEFLLKEGRAVCLNHLRTKFRLLNQVSDQRWRSGMGKVIGGVSRHAVESLYCPTSFDNYHKYRSEYSVFRGKNWGEVLVVPYHDLPERVSGFFFVGRGGNNADKVFRRTPLGQGGQAPSSQREFGLAGLTLAIEAKGDVVAVEDPLLMCRVQNRQLSILPSPIPLVACYDGDQGTTRAGWKCLNDRKVIVWNWKPTFRTWLHAMRCDGYVSKVGTEGGASTLDHYVRLQPAADLYKKIRRYAVPWRDALSAEIEAGGDGWTESLLRDFKRTKIDPEHLASQLCREAGERVRRVAFPRPEHRSVEVGRKRVIEKDGGWWFKPAEKKDVAVKITSFILRVDSARTENELRYKGRVLLGDKVMPFDAAATHFDRAHQFFQALAHKHQAGTVFIRDGWGRRLVRVAQAFHTPAYEEGSSESL